MSSNPFVKKISLRASTIVLCYTKVNLILMHQLFLARRAPRQLQIGLTDGNFHSTPEDNYRQIYYEALDLFTGGNFHSTPKDNYRQIYYEVLYLVVESINSRFNNQGIKFIALLKILFSMHAVGVLMTQS